MKKRINIVHASRALALVSALSVALMTSSTLASTDQAAEAPVNVSALPEYHYCYDNGLYATLAAFLRNKKPVCVSGEQVFLLNVNHFRVPMLVHAVLQDHEAPLVVLIPGMNATATKTSYTRLWSSWLSDAGFNVLYFDSTFRPEMVSVMGRGVSGNVWSDAEAVRDIIDAFLKSERVGQKVTKIGLVGQSYGSTIALILGQMATEGRIPFKIDAIQAYSPPVDVERSWDLFDKWFNDYRWCFTLVELQAEVAKHKPVACGSPSPLPDRVMKAAISAVFHMELIPVVITNDGFYHLGQLEHGNMFDDKSVRFDSADQFGFTRFAYSMTVPYWEAILGPGKMHELMAAANLNEILKHQPSCSETIIAHDDPFNYPEDLRELESHAAELPITILPHGGHMGYIDEEWTRAKLLHIFDCAKAR
jgi:predicted alpha/beta-fold hydrolase